VEWLEDRTLLSFDFSSNSSVGMAPHALALRDFNRAGLVGAVVANSGSNDLSVLLSNGDGTLRDFGQRFSSGGTNPVALVMGDFNGDGNLDIAVANTGSHNVSVLLGNGDGSFRLQTPAIDVGATPTAVAAASLRGNGTLDLVVALANNNVAVLLGNGDGTFANTTVPMGSNPVSVALGDLGNGHVGIVVANQANNTVSVRLGNGDGTFANATNYAVGTGPAAVALGDLTGTGRQDIAVANSGSNNVSVLLSNGDGTFRSATSYAVGAGPKALAIRDFHNRSKRDLVVTNGGSNNVSVLFGNGDGTFQAPLNYNVGTNPSAVGVLDLDGNRTPDLLVANQGSNNVTVLLNHPETSKFVVTADTGNVAAGTAFTFVVMAEENFDNIVTSYRGSVSFSSTDSKAALPGFYNFTDADQGHHTFSATFKTAGVQKITVTDRSTSSIIGTSNGISVAPAAAATLSVTGPSTSTVGAPVTVTVTAMDPYNNIATSYTGRVHFTSSDVKATLPPDFTFAPTDHGTHDFAGNLNSAGTDTVSATDSATASITGSTTVTVSPSNTAIKIASSNDSSDLDEAVTFTITVNAIPPGGGKISGSVTLQDANATLAVVPLNGGSATYTTSTLSAGRHLIQVVYAGNGDYVASTSTVLTQRVGNPDQRFVGQTYLDLLHRGVDPSGLATWTGQLQAGALHIQVVFAIEQSTEYRTILVQSAYNRYLHRAADAGGLANFVAFLAGGGTPEQLAAVIAASPEYFQRIGGGTNDGFLTALYRDALGRDIDPVGRAAYSQALAQGASRGQIAAAIFASTEYLQNLVQSFYQTFLHRGADPIGLNAFLTALQNGAHDDEVIATIVASPEYLANV
jgi:hypothetical protein